MRKTRTPEPRKQPTLIAYSSGIAAEDALPHEIRLMGRGSGGEPRKVTLVHYPASYTELRLSNLARRFADANANALQTQASLSAVEAKVKQRPFLGRLSDSGEGAFFREYYFGKGRRTKKAVVEITAELRDGDVILNAQNTFSHLSRKQNALIQADVYNTLASVADAFLEKVRRISASPSLQISISASLPKAPDQGASLRNVKTREIVPWSHATRSKPEAYLSYVVKKRKGLPKGANVALLLSTDSHAHACTVVTLPSKKPLSVPQAFSAALDLLHYRSPYTAWFKPAGPSFRNAVATRFKSFKAWLTSV